MDTGLKCQFVCEKWPVVTIYRPNVMYYGHRKTKCVFHKLMYPSLTLRVADVDFMLGCTNVLFTTVRLVQIFMQ